MTEDIIPSNLKRTIEESRTPVAVYIHATWCGPCRSFSDVVAAASKKFNGKIKFVKLDATDKYKEYARSELKVSRLPTVILFNAGTATRLRDLEKDRYVGSSKDAFFDWLNKQLKQQRTPAKIAH